MQSKHRKLAHSPAASPTPSRASTLPSTRSVRRAVEAALVGAARQAAAWAREQGLPALTGRSWEVQAGEVVRATLAEDVERWQWAVTHNLRALAAVRPENALIALRQIAATDRASASVLSECDAAFWRRLADEESGDRIRDELAQRWQEMCANPLEDDMTMLVRYLQHPDPGMRELALQATPGAPVP